MTGHETRQTLLMRLITPEDQEAWEEFAELYTPLIYKFCYKRGLQEADAADVVQEVMKAIAKAIGQFEYDPQRSSFRNWLFVIVRSKLATFFRRKQRQPFDAGESTVQRWCETAASDPMEAEWDREYRQHLLAWATKEIRDDFKPTTWQAFWRTAIRLEPAAKVAGELELSLGALYVARSRVATRLKEKLQTLSDQWPEIGTSPTHG